MCADQGDVTNYNGIRQRSWQEIAESSSRIVTFLDQAGTAKARFSGARIADWTDVVSLVLGHEDYLKTALFGLIGQTPDYGLVGMRVARCPPV